jgi:hypothetical protein
MFDFLYYLGSYIIMHPMISAIILISLISFIGFQPWKNFSFKSHKSRKTAEQELLALANASIARSEQKRQEAVKYQSQIQRDFADFHAEDADNDIQTFIFELFQIKYEGKESFEKANVSEKVILNVGKRSAAKITRLVIQSMQMVDYQKSLNSATIKYHVSVGYTKDGFREFKAYEIEYTLQLKDECGAQTYLKCKNCGAELTEHDGICVYCGTRNVRDTIMNWAVTNLKEL